MISTRLTEYLDITHPIIQAPMALAAGGKLAAAVAEARDISQTELQCGESELAQFLTDMLVPMEVAAQQVHSMAQELKKGPIDGPRKDRIKTCISRMSNGVGRAYDALERRLAVWAQRTFCLLLQEHLSSPICRLPKVIPMR